MRDGNVWAPKSHFWLQRLPAWHRQVDRCSLQHLYVGSTSEHYFSHFGAIFPLDRLFEVAHFSMFFSSFPIFRRWKLKILIWKFIFLKVLEISSILRYRKLSSDLWARRTRSKRFWKTFFFIARLEISDLNQNPPNPRIPSVHEKKSFSNTFWSGSPRSDVGW